MQFAKSMISQTIKKTIGCTPNIKSYKHSSLKTKWAGRKNTVWKLWNQNCIQFQREAKKDTLQMQPPKVEALGSLSNTCKKFFTHIFELWKRKTHIEFLPYKPRKNRGAVSIINDTLSPTSWTHRLLDNTLREKKQYSGKLVGTLNEEMMYWVRIKEGRGWHSLKLRK